MDIPQGILFIVYLLVGPAAWVLLALGAHLGRIKMSRLFRRTPSALPSDPPAVTVLVPAKDEGEPVRACIESILAQDYPKLAVVAIDDRSTDDTGPILDDVAARSGGRVRALHVAHGALPAGWLGKCNALHTAARDVQTPWILFVDSDVRLEPNAVSRVLAEAEARKHDAVTLLTRLECHTFLEKLVLPLAAAAWSIMHAISRTNDDNRPNALANGQFLLVRTSAYRAVGGHEAVRDRITEDVELVRLMKAAGSRVRFLMGAKLASTRMHATLPQMFRGWGRIYSGTGRRSPWRIIAAMAFLVVSGFSAYAALAWGLISSESRPWAWAALAHLIVMTPVLGGLYADSGNARRSALLFPIGGGLLLAIFVFALKWCATGRIEWRGTTFDQNRRGTEPAPAPATRA